MAFLFDLGALRFEVAFGLGALPFALFRGLLLVLLASLCNALAEGIGVRAHAQGFAEADSPCEDLPGHLLECTVAGRIVGEALE
ncbi:hypothetical protein [Streptomyces jeddahensis]|uniref:hypothetical protein n=1 Tax=Streptomyces jeddahensis TaxID=1716141 RepID=UPI00083223F1|nr:hypothetical protein [Streptomyces jeddahensis]